MCYNTHFHIVFFRRPKKDRNLGAAPVLFSLPVFGNYGKTKVALIGQIVKGCQACRMIFFLLVDAKSILIGFYSAPAVPVLWVLGGIPNKQKRHRYIPMPCSPSCEPLAVYIACAVCLPVSYHHLLQYRLDFQEVPCLCGFPVFLTFGSFFRFGASYER